jgi:hypothetical protein
MWREFGRWVFAIAGERGSLAYSQATACEADQPDESVAGDLQLALTQLALQGLGVDPAQVLVWSNSERSYRPDAIEALFPGRVRVEARPPIALPERRSRLLPEDVRAARRERARRHRGIAMIAGAAVLYLALIVWLAAGLWSDIGKMKRLAVKAEAVAPIALQYDQHQTQWLELSPVVESSEWPVQLLFRCVRQIPANSQLRLSVAEMTSDDAGRIQQLRLVGEAAETGPISKFSLALNRSDLLSMFQWETPPPQQNKKGSWSFTFVGARPEA